MAGAADGGLGDGTGLQIADTPETAGFFGRKISCHGPGSYPALKLSALVECGTRALIDVVFGPHDTPEPEQNAVLCRSLRPGMLVLADRASDGYPLMCKAVATGADLLWRIQNNRSLAVIHTLPDGSYLSMVADVRGRDRLRYWARHPRPVPPQVEGVAVRVIDATVTATVPTAAPGPAPSAWSPRCWTPMPTQQRNSSPSTTNAGKPRRPSTA